MATNVHVQGLTYVPDPAAFTPDTIAFFDSANPNVGSPTFYTDPDDIAATTDPTLAATPGTLYVGTDGSSWIWDGTQYITQTTPDATAWNFAGTNTDAGASKVASIARRGSISVSDLGRGSAGQLVAARRENLVQRSPLQAFFASLSMAVGAAVPVIGLGVNFRLRGNLCNAATGVTVLVTSDNASRINGPATAGWFRANTMTGGRCVGVATGVNAQALTAGQNNSDVIALRGECGTTGAGTVAGNSYALYLANSGNAAVSGTSYGIYQTFTEAASATAPRNYLRGWTGINTNAPTANLTVNGTANKTGGGTWAVASDERIKRDIKPYKRGLRDLRKINPVTFRYKLEYIDSLIDPKASATDRSINRRQSGATYVGVIAQQVREVLPGTVKPQATAFLSDQLEFDGNELTYLLVNAVKELAAEVEALRAKVGGR